MWPWEHVAAAYLAYSLFAWALYKEPPREDAALVVAVVALLPDLIDKPLAWGLELLPSGRSLAHSLLFALPTIAAAIVTLGKRLGAAIALTYLGHLAGDVVYPISLGQPPATDFLLWPVLAQPPPEWPGLLARTEHLAGAFLDFLGTARGRVYILAEFALLGSAGLVWVLDGSPGLGPVRRRLHAWSAESAE